MTGAVLDRPVSARERPALDGGGSLEELLTSAIREAQANGSTDCPLCGARMTSTRAGAREADGAAGVAAECEGCGSRLS
jgi:hypothetical protein